MSDFETDPEDLALSDSQQAAIARNTRPVGRVEAIKNVWGVNMATDNQPPDIHMYSAESPTQAFVDAYKEGHKPQSVCDQMGRNTVFKPDAEFIQRMIKEVAEKRGEAVPAGNQPLSTPRRIDGTPPKPNKPKYKRFKVGGEDVRVDLSTGESERLSWVEVEVESGSLFEALGALKGIKVGDVTVFDIVMESADKNGQPVCVQEWVELVNEDYNGEDE